MFQPYLSSINLRGLLRSSLVLLLCLGSNSAFADIPADQLLKSLRPSADVNDYANILTGEQTKLLEARCKELRAKSGAQLAVVTVKSLDGGQIDDFANKLFAQWGIGEKGKNNGLLLIVAMEDRKARVEVGYGLEPVLPDALAGRVLNQNLFPAFKQKQYFEGLQASVNRLCEIVEKGEPASAADHFIEEPLGLGEQLLMTGFLSLFVAAGCFVGGIGLRSKMLPIILFGCFFAGIPFLMGFLMAPPIAPIVHVIVGVLMGILGWMFGAGGRGSRSSSNWTWGDGTSGTWSSGDWSSSSGGFSSDWGGFGGGSSGGGGASGGW